MFHFTSKYVLLKIEDTTPVFIILSSLFTYLSFCRYSYSQLSRHLPNSLSVEYFPTGELLFLAKFFITDLLTDAGSLKVSLSSRMLVRCGCRITRILSVVKFFKNKINKRNMVTPHDILTTTCTRSSDKVDKVIFIRVFCFLLFMSTIMYF